MYLSNMPVSSLAYLNGVSDILHKKLLSTAPSRYNIEPIKFELSHTVVDLKLCNLLLSTDY
jgi:hypothetical protein